jgi:hypothetical protein
MVTAPHSPGGPKKSSSSNTGESRAYLQEDVFPISVSMGVPLDDLDGVVDSFEHAGVQGMSPASQDAL